MSSPEDLRGSTPIFTARDVLIEVRDEVRSMKTSVDVLSSQNLNARVISLETDRDRLRGLGIASGVMAFIATVMSIVVVVMAITSPA